MDRAGQDGHRSVRVTTGDVVNMCRRGQVTRTRVDRKMREEYKREGLDIDGQILPA